MGDGGFTIDGLGHQEVVVEYICNYTSVITGTTSQVKMKPSEVADVRLERVGGYVVQVRSESLVIVVTELHMEESSQLFANIRFIGQSPLHYPIYSVLG